MKRIFSIFVVLTTFLLTSAAPLTPTEALARLQSSGKHAPAVSVNHNSLKLVFSGETSIGEPAYYIFTDESGTLFVSADDDARALLGYSSTGNIDVNTLSSSLKWWLGEYTREIEWVRDHENSNMPQLSIETESLRKVASESKAPIKPLLTTTWSQGYPFNMLCPEKDGERTVTGCVATAMAQVMNYFKWPVDRVEPISYTWNDRTLSSHATVIEWDKMIDSYNDSFQESEAIAVAELMRLVGYAVEMNYGTSEEGGSGAYDRNARNAFVDIFGYDVATNYVLRNFSTAEQWEDEIYNNLLNAGPVYYSGNRGDSGHAFVCDGYDGNGYFHINWGWGGMEDGYFLLNALNPGNLGIGGGNGGYNYNQGAMLGVRRPVAGSTTPVPFIGCSGIFSAYSEGNKLVMKTEEENGGFWNYGFYTADFGFDIKLRNTVSGDAFYLGSFDTTLEPNYGYGSLWCTLGSSVPAGNYDVTLVYCVNGGDWMPFKFIEGSPDHININWADGKIVVTNDNDIITIKSVEYLTSFEVDKPYEFEIDVVNNNYSDVTYTVNAYLCTANDDSTLHIEEALGFATTTLPGRGEGKMHFAGSLSEIEAGEYYLAFADTDLNLLYYEPVEVGEGGEIKLIRYNADPYPLKSGFVSSVETIVENAFKDSKTIEIGLYLCTYSSEDNIYYSSVYYGSEEINMDGNSQTSVTYSTSLPGLPEDTYYLVWVDMADNKIMGYAEVSVDFTTSFISPVEEPEEIKLYTLQGVEVDSNNPAPGIYICKQGGRTRKIIVK